MNQSNKVSSSNFNHFAYISINRITTNIIFLLKVDLKFLHYPVKVRSVLMNKFLLKSNELSRNFSKFAVRLQTQRRVTKMTTSSLIDPFFMCLASFSKAKNTYKNQF